MYAHTYAFMYICCIYEKNIFLIFVLFMKSKANDVNKISISFIEKPIANHLLAHIVHKIDK